MCVTRPGLKIGKENSRKETYGLIMEDKRKQCGDPVLAHDGDKMSLAIRKPRGASVRAVPV